MMQNFSFAVSTAFQTVMAGSLHGMETFFTSTKASSSSDVIWKEAYSSISNVIVRTQKLNRNC